VTVDVFRFEDPSWNAYFYQWAIAFFEAVSRSDKHGNRMPAMEMVFFQAWSDEIVKDKIGPLNIFDWQERVTDSKLNGLPTILRLPTKEGVLK
jgi:hypothetical protein